MIAVEMQQEFFYWKIILILIAQIFSPFTLLLLL